MYTIIGNTEEAQKPRFNLQMNIIYQFDLMAPIEVIFFIDNDMRKLFPGALKTQQVLESFVKISAVRKRDYCTTPKSVKIN